MECYGECWVKTSTYEKCGSIALVTEKQEEIQGQWQRGSLAKEYLEQVKCCKDTDCTPQNDETGLPCVERRMERKLC